MTAVQAATVAPGVARTAALSPASASRAPSGQGFPAVLDGAVRSASAATTPVAELPSITLAAALGLTPAVPVPAVSADGSVVRPVAAAVGSGLAPTTAAGGWAQRLPAAGQRWAGAIQAAADDAGVDPALLAALVRAESGFRADAVSHAGAIGLSQLMPATARGLGVDPHDPVANLEGGARFLRSMLDKFGRTDLALAAYNAGPARVSRAGGIPDITETRRYVPKVLGYYEELR